MCPGYEYESMSRTGHGALYVDAKINRGQTAMPRRRKTSNGLWKIQRDILPLAMTDFRAHGLACSHSRSQENDDLVEVLVTGTCGWWVVVHM